MKKAFLFVFLLIFNGIACAQLVQSKLFEGWLNNSWQNSQKYTYSYDSSGYVSYELNQNWNRVSNTWANSSQYNYINNIKNGNINQFIAQFWDNATKQWLNSERDVYTYTISNKISTAIIQNWKNGAWYDTLNDTYTYDNNDHLEKYISEVRDSSHHSWNNDIQILFTNNSKGLLNQYIWQNWNSLGTNSWDNASKSNYTYDSSGRVITSIYSSWVNSNWQNGTQLICTYSNSRLSDRVEQHWNEVDNSWVNYENTIFSYNCDSSEHQEIWGQWDGSSNWTNGERDTYFYLKNSPCNIDTTVSQDFQIYPNPTSGLLYIKTPESEDVAIMVTDMIGRVIYQGNSSGSSHLVDLQYVTPCIYLVWVKTKDKIYSKKIVKE